MNKYTPPLPEEYLHALWRWCLSMFAILLFVEMANSLLMGSPLTPIVFFSSDIKTSLSRASSVLMFVALSLLISDICRLSRKEILWLALLGTIWTALVYSHYSGKTADLTKNSYEEIALFGLQLFCMPGVLWVILTTALPSNILKRSHTPDRQAWKFLALFICLYPFTGLMTIGALRVGAVIYPLVYDQIFYKIDAAFGSLTGPSWAQTVYHLNNIAPMWVQQATTFAYSIISALFWPIIAFLIREKKLMLLNGLRAVLIPFIIAWFCYMWLPGLGPGMAFYGPDNAAALPHAADLAAELVAAPPAYRNAMPSMHMFAALEIMLVMAGSRYKKLFGLSVALVLATVWTTLGLGEHYVIDLVVALPLAASLGVLLLLPPYWRQPAFVWRWVWGGCFAAFFAWMLVIRLAPQWLYEQPNVTRGCALVSTALALALMGRYIRSVWRLGNDIDAGLVAAPALPAASAGPAVPAAARPRAVWLESLMGQRWLVAVFFGSGLAALVYEVVYAKALAVTFGGTTLAANTVLATYMGGMALGAWLGGVVADRAKAAFSALHLYAVFELAIGLYAAATPVLFPLVLKLYVALATDVRPDAPYLTALRVLLGVAVLIVPTLLMGATLPLACKHLAQTTQSTTPAQAIAPLYGANVLGAALGALIAGYVLLPSAGRSGATLIAALLSLLVALYALGQAKEMAAQPAACGPADGTPAAADSAAQTRGAPWPGRAAILVLLIGGGLTLALETVYMFLLGVVAGNSVYAFGLMLATFLLGLGLGAAACKTLGRWLADATLVTLAQCGIALALTASAFMWDGLPGYFASFGHLIESGMALSFGARELIRAMVCALVMLPPAFFIGLSYPAAMALAADRLGRRQDSAAGVGAASAINTVGNILGVLLAGFVFLPAWGSRDTLHGLASVSALLAVLMFAAQALAREGGALRWSDNVYSPASSMARAVPAFTGAAIALTLLGLLIWPASWNYTALSNGANVYFSPTSWGEAIDHAESTEGGLTTVTRSMEQAHDADGKPLTLHTLLTNGKFQGNDSPGGEMLAQESFALLPLLHQPRRGAALVIGYGTGMTARMLHEQGFAQLDIAELAPDIVHLADRYFASLNHGISSQPGVRVFYTDGRNYLLTQNQRYDLISIELTSIWFAGAANLYNREFYELAAARLAPGGVLQQWVQLHHMRPIDFVTLVNSARSVFRYVNFYMRGGQGILVMTNDAASAAENPAAQDALARGLQAAGSTATVPDLKTSLVADAAAVDQMLRRNLGPGGERLFISTDNNLYLEYATPKGNAVTDNTTATILRLFFAAPDSGSSRNTGEKRP